MVKLKSLTKTLAMSPQIEYFKPVGILDGTQSEEFKQNLNDLIAQGAKIILIDFQEVTFMDSSGLGTLVISLKNARAADVQLYICSINEQIKMLFELTSMDRALEIFANREEFEQKFSLL